MVSGGSGGPSNDASPIRVLHVDDDDAMLDLLAAMLEREAPALSVTSVTGAADGLAALADADFDCVVSDYDMPGMDGLEFLEVVREHHGDLPFVLFTGKGSEEIASEAIAAGVTDYLQKGGGSERYAMLANRIENAVERHRAQRAVEETRRWHQRLVEASSDVILVADPDGTIRYTSPSIEGVLGYEPVALVGSNAFEFVHPDDRARFEAAHSAIAAGDPTVPRVEFRCANAEGAWVTVESHSRNLEDDPTIGGIVVYVRDVSARRARESELTRYERIVEATGDVVYALDDEGRFTFVNDAHESLTGYAEAEVLGEHVSVTLGEEDVERGEAVIRELLRDEARTCKTYEMTVHTRDGELVPVENHLALLTDDRGDFVGSTGVLRDVTERKEREREFERYARIVGAIGDGVYALDPDGMLVEFNDYLVELTGYDRRELVGASVALWYDEEDVERFERAIRALLSAEGKDVETVQATLHTADGEEVVVEVNLTLLPAADGEFRGTVGVIRDVTERRERELELETYETLVEASGDAMYALDAEGRITFVNDAHVSLTGYPEAEVLGEHVSVRLREEDVERGEALIREMLADDDRRSDTIEMDVVTRDGRRIPCENHVAILPMEDGEFRGTAGVLRDISERKERERTLRSQNERLDRFASMVSHDLRNPLNVAVARVQMERQENDGENLAKAQEALVRMGEMVDDVLSLARNGGGVVDSDDVAFARCVDAAWESVDSGAATLAVSGEPGTLLADGNRLQRLLENLFRNAVGHGGPEVTVRVGWIEGRDDRDDGGHDDPHRSTGGGPSAGFYVEDDGPGVPEADRQRVFEFGETADAEADGTGFGLAIVEEIARAHGWTVRVTGSASGGARFEVTGVAWVDPA